jgi:flagellar hook-length control protein FliK
MPTSPTTSVLGPVATTGRPAGASNTGRRDDAGENSGFSAAFSDATDSAQAASQDEAGAASKPDSAAATANTHRGRIEPAAKSAEPAGNALPSDGDILPLEGVLLAAVDMATGDADTADATDTGSDADAGQITDVTAVQTALPPVLPETPVHAAFGAHMRGPIAAGPHADADADMAAGDATSAQKREIPTPPQTLAVEPAGAVSEDMPAPVAADSFARQHQSAVAVTDADSSAGVNANANANANAIARVDANNGVGIAQAAAKGDETPPAFADPRQAGAAAAAGAASAATAARSGGKSVEAAALVDALTQADASQTATQAAPDTPATVATVRDTGLRQYIDAAASTGVRVDVPVGRPGWSEAVTDKVMWMSAQNIASAEIHLSPADLGPLSIRISSHQDQTSVYFTSAHASVRDALDQSLPRLREMFSGQGIQLLDVGVGDQHAARDQSAQREAFAASTRGRAREMSGATDEGVMAARPLMSPRRSGLLDAYA